MLTKRQKQILDYIKSTSAKNGFAPSLEEIAKHFRLSSVATVHEHIENLRSKGYLEKKENQPRSIELSDETAPLPQVIRPTTPHNTLVSLPIYGSANCGVATIYAENNIQGYLTISGKLLTRKKDVFAIKATGYSMNKANVNGLPIEDGDYVIVDPKYRSIRNGDYVLSVIDGAANIKRYFADRENRRIILLSESSASLPPIIIHEDEMDSYLVNGKIIQVIKRPKTTLSKFKDLIYRRID